MSSVCTIYESGTSLNWDGDTKVCPFYMLPIKTLFFCWVPSLIAIRGNEKAGSVAKSTLDVPCVKVYVPYTDFKHHISQYILSTWQDDWNSAVMNKLHSVKPVLEDWQAPTGGAGRMKLSYVGPASVTHI